MLHWAMMDYHQLIVVDQYLRKVKERKKTDLSTIGCFSLLLVCFLFNRMGDLGGEKTFVDVDDVVDDVVDSI